MKGNFQDKDSNMEGYFSTIKLKNASAVTSTLLQQVAGFVANDLGKIPIAGGKSAQLESLIMMNNPVGTPKKLRVEFDSKVKRAFEADYASKTQQQKDTLPYVVMIPPIKSTSILLTQVPSKWDEATLHGKLFGNQPTKVLSFKREEKNFPNGSKYNTGRAWFNLTQESFLPLRKIPSEVKVTKDWKIKVHCSKKEAKSKKRTCPLCKQSGNDLHPIQQCKKGTLPTLFPQQKRYRTNSMSSPINTISKKTLPDRFKIPDSKESKFYRKVMRIQTSREHTIHIAKGIKINMYLI